jgi:CheY-like chemotaxis protein
LKILVADDDECTSSLYHKILERRGHIVQITCDDEECLKKYVETLHQVRSTSISNIEVTRFILPYDVVILDYKMSKAIGVRVANNILSLNPRQRIVIATPDAQDAVTKLSDGVNTIIEILEKPFSNKKLEETIERKSSCLNFIERSYLQ